MKIKCPNCRTTASIDDTKIPDNGLRAKCPRCGHAMLIKKGDPIDADNKTRPSPEIKQKSNDAAFTKTSPGPTSKRPSERKKSPETPGARLLRRIQEKQSAREGDDLEIEDELADVSVEVQIGPNSRYMLAGVSALVVIASIVLILWSNSIEKDMPQFAPPADHSHRGAGVLYGSPDMESIVHRMRLKIRRDDYRSYWAPFPSPEIRVLAEITRNCEADCSEIDEARLGPLETHDGFFTEVSCGEHKKHNITYYWTTNSAWIDDRQCR